MMECTFSDQNEVHYLLIWYNNDLFSRQKPWDYQEWTKRYISMVWRLWKVCWDLRKKPQSKIWQSRLVVLELPTLLHKFYNRKIYAIAKYICYCLLCRIINLSIYGISALLGEGTFLSVWMMACAAKRRLHEITLLYVGLALFCQM